MDKTLNITEDFDIRREATLPKSEISDLVFGTWVKLRRQKWIILACTTFFALSGIFYVANAPLQYTAGASLIIDPRLGASPQQPNGAALLLSDALLVDSEVRVLRSRNLTDRLFDRLGLAESEKLENNPSAIEKLGRWVGEVFSITKDEPDGKAQPRPLSRDPRREAMRRAFIRNLSVQRAGNTYVIEIQYTSRDRDFSATVVNTLIEEYFTSASEENFENAKRFSEWLTQRIAILEEELSGAEEALASYREQNNLFAVRGTLLPAQAEISALTQQALELEAALFEIDGDLFGVRDMLASGSINTGTVFDTKYTLLRDIQRDYLDVLEEKREIVSLRGTNAPQLTAVEKEIDVVSAQIFSEIARIEESLLRRKASMKRMAASIEDRLAELRVEASIDAQNTIQLRGLERDVAAKQNQLENMLKEFNSITQSRTFVQAPARIMGWAVAPDKKSSPKSKQVVVLSTFAGLMLGAFLGLLREELDRSFRTPDDILDDFGLSYIGLVPTMRSDRKKLNRMRRPRNPADSAPLHTVPRRIRNLFFAAREPKSMMADTLRAVMIAFNGQSTGERGEQGGYFASSRTKASAPLLLKSPINEVAARGSVIGFASAKFGDGKTTLAANFASFLSACGTRTILIDLDFTASSVTKAFDPLPESNLIDQLLSGESLASDLSDLGSFCDLTVIGHKHCSALSPSSPMCGARLRSVISALKRNYDVIVVDMAPPNVCADARAVSKLLDGIVLIVEWGKTPKSLLKSMLRLNPDIRENVLGVIYNKVNIKKFDSYAVENKLEYYGH